MVKVMAADGGNVQTLARGDEAVWFGAAPTRTSVNASPEPVAEGAPLTVMGKVTKVGVALPAATVKIRLKAAGTRRFTTVGTATTGSKGRFQMTVTARKTGTWKAVHRATAATLASSAKDQVTVRRR